MKDTRLKDYWSNEIKALLDAYQQFEILIPSTTRAGAAHVGEDGRYVEHLLREYLKKYLPRDLEVLTGFILRAAVVCGKRDNARKKDEHENSSQLDIIVYDTAHYPVYQRFGDSVIVPAEGVVAVISVKKYLRIKDIKHEIEMLGRASSLCVHKKKNGRKARSPFTALISMKDKINEGLKKELNTEEKAQKVYSLIEDEYKGKKPLYYDEMIDFVGTLSEWCLYKERKRTKKETNYYFYEYDSGKHYWGFQLILQNILSVYYENTTEIMASPGYLDNSGEGYTKKWGALEYHAVEISRK